MPKENPLAVEIGKLKIQIDRLSNILRDLKVDQPLGPHNITLLGSELTNLIHAKILTFGRTRLRAAIDLYNVLNGNTVLGENRSFDANWLRPAAILPARLSKFAFQFDF